MKYEQLESKVKEMVKIIPDMVKGKMYYGVTVCADGLAFTTSVTSDEKMAQELTKTLTNCLINEMRHLVDDQEKIDKMLVEFCEYLAKEGIYDLGRSTMKDGKSTFHIGAKAHSATIKFLMDKGFIEKGKEACQ